MHSTIDPNSRCYRNLRIRQSYLPAQRDKRGGKAGIAAKPTDQHSRVPMRIIALRCSEHGLQRGRYDKTGLKYRKDRFPELVVFVAWGISSLLK